MSYRHETSDSAERLHAAAWAAAKLEDHVRSDLKEAFGETYSRWAANAPWVLTDIVDAQVRSLTALVLSAERTAVRAEGVETARGTHDRYTKLRHGCRIHDCGESRTRWYVIPAAPGWLDGLLADALYEYPEDIPEWGSYDRNRDARDEYVEEALADVCETIYGDRPGRIEIHSNYDCTGRTFATMHARQTGRRVLVLNCFHLDI